MDFFKKEMNKKATTWDWNIPKYVKRYKGDTKILRKISRAKTRTKLKKELKETGD